MALSGQGVPELEGEVLGEAVRLLWPRLQVGGLWLDLGAREAGGRARPLSRLVPGGGAGGGGGASASPPAFRASAFPWRGRWT